ncbi:Por secretion system C-terminal sorting domain-containing protein [Chryseobacterium jejuense]|uniref:Major intracellular serine protease n=2 Tax=Chryseobacterium jejuense TaxID=445960 RepID=A0A2X2Z5A0_CHRJE|nr:Por secretion system C-terminal sorting domain-containing protein [Chryseobacterium jejuense]SQB45630.1 Major intracellular serine protease precursor [Chryseobacterium jejuense]
MICFHFIIIFDIIQNNSQPFNINNMKTKIKLLSLLVFSFFFSFGQSPSDRSVKQNDLIYVCFSKGISSEKDALSKNPELERFARENGISFTYDLGFNNEKINEMIASSQRNGNSGESVQKLKRIFKANIPAQDGDTFQRITKILEKFPEIEYVSVMSSTPVEPPLVNMFVATPDLESVQTYLNDNPGINAKYAWSRGITGQNIRIRDVEYGFYKTHEMLTNQNSIQLEPGYSPNSGLANNNYRDHGTAVVSILGSIKDNIGLTGAVYSASEIKGYMEWTTVGYNRASAVSRSINASQSGDVILYEMQTGGKDGQYCPAEYDSVIWDLTKAATDSGIIIIAAAGNGNQDLDDPFYATYRARGNSGAIIVGAGTPNTTHSKQSFSTYGSRVDVQGWGSSVLAAGYGSYAKYDNDNNRTYNYFSGTSSATPTVASAAVLVQSFYRQTTGQNLTPAAMRSLLVSTGIPQGGTDVNKKIGPLPNVKNAILQLEGKSTASAKALPVLEVKIYPNPSSNYIAIQNTEDKKLDIEIINMQGRSVIKNTVSSGEKINISNLPTGQYLININEGSRRVVEKFTKL